MKKLIVTILPILILLSSQTVFAKFSDVDTAFHEYTAINWLEDQGVVEGYSDMTFKPDQPVNRAEFLKMLYETIGMKGKTPTLPFPDVPYNTWYTKYVQEAYSTGVIQGYPDGYFRPDNQINVVEALKIIDEAFFDVNKLYGDGTGVNYCPNGFFTENPMDIDQKAWYNKYAQVAGSLCIFDFGLNAFGMGGFLIDSYVDRGDMAELLYRAKTVKDNENHYYTKELIPDSIK